MRRASIKSIRPKHSIIVLLLMFTSCGGQPVGSSNLSRSIIGPNVGTLDLLGVAFVDSKTGWAVGDIDPGGGGGAIYQTLDAGLNWRPIARTNEILTAVHFVNLKIGWVAGHAGLIERTDDGGLSWKPQRIERQGEVLNSIYFIDERRGWVAGGNGLVFRTTDGGESWNKIATGRIEDLWAVRFSNPERGWIVGEDGLILSTEDGGNNWVAQSSGTSRALLGLALSPSADVVVAVGEGGMIFRSAGRSNWVQVESPAHSTLDSVAASGSTFWAVGVKGMIVRSTDNGVSFIALPVLSPYDLNSISLADATHGVAVGQRGVTQLLQSQ
ncbi:MAG TPA: YCF48-related protein [Blastocatellia bacterium]|nr:YCF48-related protein [Blastocatellia bacterium]